MSNEEGATAVAAAEVPTKAAESGAIDIKRMSDKEVKEALAAAKEQLKGVEKDVTATPSAVPFEEVDEPEAAGESVDNNEVLLKKIEQLEKELAKKTNTVDRMGNELGSLRNIEAKLKHLEAQQAESKAISLDKLVEDPRGAIRSELESSSRDLEIQALKAEHARRQRMQQHQDFLKQHAPTLETDWESIADVIKEDGADPSELRSRIYEIDPLVTFNLVRRAELAKKVKELAKQVEALKASGPELLKKVDAAARTGVKITGKSSGATITESPKFNVKTMSPAEIKEALRKRGVVNV